MSATLSPVQRTARLIRLLLGAPIAQADLQDQLQLSPAQLRRDLAALRAEGYDVQVFGAGAQPRTLWISAESLPRRCRNEST